MFNVGSSWTCNCFLHKGETERWMKKTTKKTSSNTPSCGLELGAFRPCVCSSLFFFCFCQFPSFDVYLWVPVSLVWAHTIPPPSSFVFVLLCLVSIRSQRVKGWGPLIPLGTTGGSEDKQGSSRWGLSTALCTSDCRRFLAF